MLDKLAIQVKPGIWELLLRGLERPKDLERIQRIALKGPDNFLEVLAAGSRLMDERIPPSSPEEMTLAEALKMREIRMLISPEDKESETLEARIKSTQALEVREVLISLIEKVLSRIKGWSQEKVVEILLRSMAFLIFAEAAREGGLIDQIDEKLSSLTPVERDVYYTFPEGIWKKIKAYLITEDRDRTIFKILADLWGNEFPIILTRDEKKTPFASWGDQKGYFNREEAKAVENRVRERRKSLLFRMEEVWQEIKNFKSREISPGGWDKILIPDQTPLGRLGIKYLRFIREGINPPAVGLEIELENGKVLLAKINNQGVLLGSWITSFPMVSWLMNSAALIHLKNLTVGGDSYDRYREERKTGGGEIKEYLVSRRERKYRYFPRYHFYSNGEREIRKIGQRKSPIFHSVTGHLRKLPPHWKPDPEARKRGEAAGFKLRPDETFVEGHCRGKEDLGKEIPPKPIKDISAAEEIEQLLEI